MKGKISFSIRNRHIAFKCSRFQCISNCTFVNNSKKCTAGHENSKITMDIYAKVKYNSPDALSTIVNNAFNNMYAKAE